VFISRVFRISACANGVLVSHSLEGIGALSERTMNGIWNQNDYQSGHFQGHAHRARVQTALTLLRLN
jgi:hypothetical protein